MGSDNFVSLGRLIIGDHKTVCDSIKAQQSRSNYLGRLILNSSKMPDNFLLFMSDTIKLESETHQAIHNYIWQDIMPAVMNRVEQDEDGTFFDYVTELAQAGKDGAPSNEVIQSVCVRYVFHALLGSIDDEFVECVKHLFFGGGLDGYVEGALKLPFCCFCVIPCCFSSKRKTNINKAVKYIVDSPMMQKYEFRVADISKEEFAKLFLAVSGIAGCLGTYNLLLNVFNEIPRDFVLDVTDRREVLLSILEATRIRAPVNNVNFKLPRERIISVHGKEVTLGEGTVCAANLHLASYDSKVFENPKEFNPKRENLMSAFINFNHVGFSPEGSGTRQCPGRNLPIKMASDLLIEIKKTKVRQNVRERGVPCFYSV